MADSSETAPMEGRRRITLLTDFGTRDGYVAAMKAVLAESAPDALLDDAGHDLPRGDVSHAAWVLGRYWRRFPPGTVHLVVVDPGVGTDRAALAVACEGRWAVAPDNGVLTPIFRSGASWRAVRLSVPGEASPTFHGRDVFAPAAGRLAAGTPLDGLGAPWDSPVLLPDHGGDPWRGRVRSVDRFGNLITDLPGTTLDGARGVEIGGARVPVAETYGEVERGSLVALVGSDGTVEVAAREESAAELLGAGTGTELRIIR